MVDNLLDHKPMTFQAPSDSQNIILSSPFSRPLSQLSFLGNCGRWRMWILEGLCPVLCFYLICNGGQRCRSSPLPFSHKKTLRSSLMTPSLTGTWTCVSYWTRASELYFCSKTHHFIWSFSLIFAYFSVVISQQLLQVCSLSLCIICLFLPLIGIMFFLHLLVSLLLRWVSNE